MNRVDLTTSRYIISAGAAIAGGACVIAAAQIASALGAVYLLIGAAGLLSYALYKFKQAQLLVKFSDWVNGASLAEQRARSAVAIHLAGSLASYFPSGRIVLNQAGGHSSWTWITSLPRELGQSSDLTHIDLSGCERLESIPAEFGQLANLHCLDADGCRSLENIPAQLSQCSQLRSLHLSGSRVTGLPAELGECPELINLWLQGCEHLTSLPFELLQRRKLKLLDLSHCRALTGEGVPRAILGLAPERLDGHRNLMPGGPPECHIRLDGTGLDENEKVQIMWRTGAVQTYPKAPLRHPVSSGSSAGLG